MVPFDEITLDTPLLDCGFAFNKKFKVLLAGMLDTPADTFHCTADMAAAWRKAKRKHDRTLTFQVIIDLHEGRSDYARYDDSACQWNRFLKDFCADPDNQDIPDKINTAARLWKTVRHSDKPKIYTTGLAEPYRQ